MSARVRIGELLINAGLLTREKLESALERQRTQGAGGRRLGQLLVDLEFVSENQLTKVLSQQLTVPWVSLHHIDFSRQLLNLVPKELAEEFCVIPVYVRHERKAGDTLYLAMDDPTHDDAVRRVMAASGLPVKSMIASPSDIRAAIRAFYGDPTPAVVAEPAPSSTATTAKSGSPVEAAESAGRKVPALPPASPAAPSTARDAAIPMPLVNRNPARKSEPKLQAIKPPMSALESTPTREAMPDLEPVEAAFAPDPVRATVTMAGPTEADISLDFADSDDVTDFTPESARPSSGESTSSETPMERSVVPSATASSRPAARTSVVPVTAVEQTAQPVAARPGAARPIRRSPPVAAVTEAPASSDRKARPRMLALTLLDGTTIQIPAQRRKGASAQPAENEPEPARSPENRLTSRDLVAALRAVAHGGNPDEILGDARWESLFAALLSLLLKKQIIADWEFVEEWQKM